MSFYKLGRTCVWVIGCAQQKVYSHVAIKTRQQHTSCPGSRGPWLPGPVEPSPLPVFSLFICSLERVVHHPFTVSLSYVPWSVGSGSWDRWVSFGKGLSKLSCVKEFRQTQTEAAMPASLEVSPQYLLVCEGR